MNIFNVFFMKRIIKWFTLVELIVVIAILAILATIWFISMQGYAKSARQSTRVADLQTIGRSIEYFKIESGYYPEPTNPFNVTFSGSLAWKQWIFWEDTRKESRRISEVPLDPLTKNPYTYSVTNNGQEYELWAISEISFSSNTQSIPLVSQLYAANSFYTYIKWNYNRQIITVRDANYIYVLWVPTIITTEITDVTVQELLSNQSFAVMGKQNLPSSYASTLPVWQTHTWAISFLTGSLENTLAPVVYEWSVLDLNSVNERQNFWENLKSYYGESNISTQDNYSNLVNTSTWAILGYVNTLIQTGLGGLPGSEIVINEVIDQCYNPWNVGTIGTQWVCNGMLIVDTAMLKSVASTVVWWDQSYQIVWPDSNTYTFGDSTYNIFTGLVTDMAQLFSGDVLFNEDINYWDTSNVELLAWMFSWASSFNQPLNNWDVSNARVTTFMFMNASSFNQPLDNWELDSMTHLTAMFWNASSFNQPLNNWDTSNIRDISVMFSWASSFNQPLNNWNTANVINMQSTFLNAVSFNQPLNNWDTSNVTSMPNLFGWSNAFDQDISNWNVVNVSNCSNFDNATLISWDISEKPNFTSCTP